MSTNTSPVDGTTISGTSQVLINQPCTYRGFSLKETTGTAEAVLVLWDSTSGASGPILDPINLAPNESAREFYDPGQTVHHGVYVQVVSGSVSGIVRTS